MGFEDAENRKPEAEGKEPETPNVDVIANYQEAKTATKDNYDKHQGGASEQNVTIVADGKTDNYDKHQGKDGGGGGKGGEKSEPSDKYDKHQGPTDKQPPMSAKEIAAAIVKNNGFGEKGSDERFKIEKALGDAMDRGGFNAKNLVKQINDELALAGSNMRVHGDVRGGGGGGGGGRDGWSTQHTESDGTFGVKENGQQKDTMNIHVESEKVFHHGKLVGGSNSRSGDNGGSGGGWGEQPPRSKDPFELDKFKLEDDIKRGGKGGGGGGKGGGKTMPG